MKITNFALLLSTLLGFGSLMATGCGGDDTEVIQPTEQFQVPDEEAKRLEALNEKVREEDF